MDTKACVLPTTPHHTTPHHSMLTFNRFNMERAAVIFHVVASLLADDLDEWLQRNQNNPDYIN